MPFLGVAFRLFFNMPNMTSGVIPPPAGLTANFDNPPSIAHVTVAVTISLVVVASIFVGLRGYAVLFILHTRGIADCKSLRGVGHRLMLILSRSVGDRLGKSC